MYFPVSPMGKPRQTQRDKWKKRPVVLRWRAFKDEMRLHARAAEFELPETFDVTFYVQMPKSWSRKKKAEHLGQPHRQRPDLDNMLKALCDALLPDEDSHVHTVTARKVWSETGGIEVSV